MNVLSRKMFQKKRSRPARDALNKAGGIMSSSPELMDTVQMFQSGGNVFSLTGQRQFGSDGVTQRIPTQPFPEIDFTDIQMTAPRLSISDAPNFQKNVPPSFSLGGIDFKPDSAPYRKTMAFKKQLLNLQKQSSLYPDKPFVGKIADPEGKGFPVFEGGKLQGFTTAMEGEVKDKPTTIGPDNTAPVDVVTSAPFDSRESFKKGLEAIALNKKLKPSDYLPSFYSPKPRATVGGEIAEGLKSVASVPGGIVSSVADLTDTVLGAPGRLDLDKVTPTGVELAGLTGSGVGREGTPFMEGEITKGAPLAGMIEEQRQEQERVDRVLGEQDRMQQGQLGVSDPESTGIQAEIEALNIAMQDKKAMQDRKTDPSLIEQENRGYNAMLDTMTQAERDADITADAATTGEESDELGVGLGTEPTADAVKDQVSDADVDRLREETRMQQGQISRSGENIAKSVETGNEDALGSQLKDLMAQFTSNAPKYEGLDKGMALMKIGFAMAAGKSPYAMQNIANALSSGADMFIKDKAKKDAFNRQVELSALQYGLGEIGKDKAQARADDRNFFKMVATKDMSFGGVNYKKGENVFVPMSSILANDGKLPSGLIDQALEIKNNAAIKAREAAFIKAKSELRSETIIKDAQANKIENNYREAVSRFKGAEAGIGYLERSLLTVSKGNVTGGTAALKDLLRKGGNIFGIEFKKEYTDLEQVKSDFAKGLQPLIKVTLGEVQSANSISNRDVEFLIKAFFGDDALSKSSFSLVTQSEEVMAERIQSAIKAMRRNQVKDLNTMSQIEKRLIGRTLPGGETGKVLESGALIGEYQEDIAPFLPGGKQSLPSISGIFNTGEKLNGVPIFDFKGS